MTAPASPICLHCALWLAIPESLKASAAAEWGLCLSQKNQVHPEIIDGERRGSTVLQSRWDATCKSFKGKEVSPGPAQREEGGTE